MEVRREAAALQLRNRLRRLYNYPQQEAVKKVPGGTRRTAVCFAMAASDLPSSPKRVPEHVRLFQRLKTAFIAWCTASIFVALLPILFAPRYIFAALICSTSFAFALCVRLWVSNFKDQERALDLFGRAWLIVTATNCSLFVIAHHYYSFVKTPSAVIYVSASFTVLVPVYLHLNGIHAAHRFGICTCIAMLYYLAPQFTVMDREQAMLLMWISLLMGEMLGTHLRAKLLQEAAAPSVVRGAPPAKSSLNDGQIPASGASGELAAGTRASLEPPTLSEQLHSYVRRHDFESSTLDMRDLTLCFDDATFEMLYGAHSLAISRELHLCIAVGAMVIGATGAYLSPSFRTVGLLGALFAACIGDAHRQKRRGHDDVSDHLLFCRHYTFFRNLLIVVFVAIALLPLDSERLLLRASPADMSSPPQRLEAQGQQDAMLLFKGSDGGGGFTDLVGLVCGAMLIVLAVVHHRLVVLPPPTRMTNRFVLLVGVACSQFDVERALLKPTVIPVFVLAVCVLMVGELVGFSVDQCAATLVLMSYTRNHEPTLDRQLSHTPGR